MPPQRAIAYIDGFNLYYGLKSNGWKRYYWLNIPAMIQSLLKPQQILTKTKYFTSVVTSPPDKSKRQRTFLEALQTLPGIEISYGHFLSSQVTCIKCQHTYTTYHEKMTDVNISVQMVEDASQNLFDLAILVSADSDLVPPIKTIKRLFPTKSIIVVFPPGRTSKALQKVADGTYFINRVTLAKCQFPNQVVKKDGFVLNRPHLWR